MRVDERDGRLGDQYCFFASVFSPVLASKPRTASLVLCMMLGPWKTPSMSMGLMAKK